MARSPNCSMCGELKGPGYENYGYCKTCKHQKRSDERAKRRAEKGLAAWGSGRNPNCKDCNAVKEIINNSYCNACKNLRARNARKGIQPVVTKRGLCPCGAERGANQPYYCLPCMAAATKKLRDSRRPAPEEVARLQAERWKNSIFKRTTRKYTQSCIRIGILVKQPCEVCGTNEEVEAHHDDYYKALDVRWLCRKHHLEHHVQIGDFKRR